MKDPKKVAAGKARWNKVSQRKRKQITSAAGKKGGAATREIWRRLKSISVPVDNA